jgi:hypothetical protein
MKTVIPQTSPEYDRTVVIERPDGFYWQEKETGAEYGPFATLVEAVEDMAYSEETEFDEAGALHEAEEEIGISDWIDPDTGAPAEELIPHIEDH